MGEAKHRGNLDERIANAQTKGSSREDIVRLLEMSKHFCLIFDKSPKGTQGLETYLQSAPTHISNPLREKQRMFDNLGWQFMAFLGTHNMTGGTTAGSASIELVLTEMLPQLMERVVAKGGYCAFMVCVDDSVKSRIDARLAELQPTQGGDSNSTPMKVGLAAINAAIQVNPPGGEPVPFERLQIDRPAFDDVTQMLLEATNSWLTSDLRDEMAMQSPPTRAERMTDGAVRVSILFADKKLHHVDVPVGQWRVLTIDEYAALKQRTNHRG